MYNCRVHPCVAQSLIAELAAHMGGTRCAALKHLLIAGDESTDPFCRFQGLSALLQHNLLDDCGWGSCQVLWCWGSQGIRAIAPCACKSIELEAAAATEVW